MNLNTDDNPIYYTYYLITNHLNCSIGLRQYRTIDNFFILQPSQTTDFAWSKLNIDKVLIEFSLKYSSNDLIYSSPVDIHHTNDNTKQQVQFLNSSHSFYLQIHYDEHRIRRHIHIIGQLILKNLCNIDLNIKLHLYVDSQQIDLLIAKNQPYISCLQTIDDVESIQWNSSDKYLIEQLNRDGIISTNEQISIWIHLFQYENFTCLIFAPVVIYRSYLTQSILLNLNKNKSFQLQSNGSYTYYNDFIFENPNQIYEHRLQQTNVEQLTQCIFELNKQTYLSTNQIENVHHDNLSLIDYILQIKQPFSEQNRSYSTIELLRKNHFKFAQINDNIPLPLIERTNEILNPSLISTFGANGPAMHDSHIPLQNKTSNNCMSY